MMLEPFLLSLDFDSDPDYAAIKAGLTNTTGHWVGGMYDTSRNQYTWFGNAD